MTNYRFNFYFEDINAQVFAIALIALAIISYQVCKCIINYVRGK